MWTCAVKWPIPVNRVWKVIFPHGLATPRNTYKTVSTSITTLLSRLTFRSSLSDGDTACSMACNINLHTSVLSRVYITRNWGLKTPKPDRAVRLPRKDRCILIFQRCHMCLFTFKCPSTHLLTCHITYVEHSTLYSLSAHSWSSLAFLAIKTTEYRFYFEKNIP